MTRKWLWALLPLGLGLAGVMLLIRVTLLSTGLFLSRDLDLVLILFGLSLAIFAAMVLIVKEVMDHLRQQSIEQARAEAFAEHLRFLQRLDHEFKNPLTALRAGLGSLALTLPDEGQRQIVQTLDAEAQQLSRLVTDLRKLAELETLPPEFQQFSVADFYAEISELGRERPELRDRQYILYLAPETASLRLVGDPDLLLLAVHNLLDNACKYTRPGDRIELRIYQDEDSLALQMMDTGIGIPAAEVPLVWEELYRGGNTHDIPGNGIGLALIKTIIERHQGSVDLHSQVGQGTTVTLYLPLV